MSMHNNNCAPATAASVANEFLRLGQITPIVPCIDQMKLQKLIFYAHAWYLAKHDRPLFEEDFEAWPWGPVIRDIYYQTRSYGREPVTQRIYEIRKTGNGPLDFSFIAPEGVSEELKPYIKEVWDAHKSFTGIQLSNSTHANGEPWTIIKEHYKTLENKPTIPNQLIYTVFKNKLTEHNK